MVVCKTLNRAATCFHNLRFFLLASLYILSCQRMMLLIINFADSLLQCVYWYTLFVYYMRVSWYTLFVCPVIFLTIAWYIVCVKSILVISFIDDPCSIHTSTKHLQFRQDFGVDSTLRQWTPPEVLVKFIPGGFFGEDREGHPVWHSNMGNLDIEG